MSQATLNQIAFVVALALLVALFVVGYVWLMRLFRKRRAPQPVTLTQRWLAAFVPVIPLCVFAAYFLVHAQPAAALDSVVFGVLGALLAATSSVSISAASRGGSPAEALAEAQAEAQAIERDKVLAAQRPASAREWPPSR